MRLPGTILSSIIVVTLLLTMSNCARQEEPIATTASPSPVTTVSPSPTAPPPVAATGALKQAREQLEQAEKEQRQKNRRAMLEHLEKAEQEVKAAALIAKDSLQAELKALERNLAELREEIRAEKKEVEANLRALIAKVAKLIPLAKTAASPSPTASPAAGAGQAGKKKP